MPFSRCFCCRRSRALFTLVYILRLIRCCYIYVDLVAAGGGIYDSNTSEFAYTNIHESGSAKEQNFSILVAGREENRERKRA